MRKTAEKKLTLQNGKELFKQCVRKLNENQQGETGGNVALYPTVIIMLGEKAKEYTRYIKNTLDDNWNNARYLQYLSVYRSGTGFKCVSLTDTEEYDRCEWDTASAENFTEALNKAIVKMLETDEKIFMNKNSVKMEFVLDATEKNGVKYYELFKDAVNGLYANDLKTLYLMIDQRPEDNRAKASDEVLQYIVKDKAEKKGTIYLLSNYLQSGDMLGENKIWQNYRLLANIVLLGGNRKGAGEYNKNLYNGIKTVAYAMVTKPTEEIAAAAIETLMLKMYEKEKNKFSKELSDKDIKERLKINSYKGFEFAEEIFRKKIESGYPGKDNFLYLPFLSKQDYKSVVKDNSITLKRLDSYTSGAALSYIYMHYQEPAERFWQDEEELSECRKLIHDNLCEAFEYFELLRLSHKREEIKRMILEEYQFGGIGTRDSFTDQIHRKGVFEGKKVFYEKIKPLIVEELNDLIDAALQYEKIYALCQKEVQQGRIITGDESESVEKVYGKVVMEFVENHQKINEHKSAFPEVFRANHGKEDLLQAFWKTFVELIQNEVFGYDFEREVDFRMGDMNAVQRQEFVSNELQKRLCGSIRLKNSIEVPCMKVSRYYLINESADYAKNLKEREENGKNYVLFDLNRTDCIEQLEIYNISNPELLHLTTVGEET